MLNKQRNHLLHGFWVTALGTLLSRVLGLARDVATASVFGLGSGALDALVLALRVPNLFRRLFGEGALATCYVPALAAERERGERPAQQFASTLLTWLAFALIGIVAVGEILCAIAFCAINDEQSKLMVGLLATLLPYLLFICLAAQLSATLQCYSRFTLSGLTPGLLNLVWLVAVLGICPRLSSPSEQAYALSICVLISGVLQAVVLLAALWRLGFRFEYRPKQCRPALRAVTVGLTPMLAGLAVTQINTLFDSLLAWILTAPDRGMHAIAWLGGIISYPLQPGATSAIYFAERFYHLPVGLIGIAIATVVFPRFSRHAAINDRLLLGRDLTTSLQLIWFLTIPASAGLLLLSGPLAELLFAHSQSSSAESARAARLIAGYSTAIWAYCALPVIVRAFYALSDQVRPLRIAVGVVSINLALDVSLVWIVGELGLAISTAVAAVIQVAALLIVYQRSYGPLEWSSVVGSLAKTLFLTLLMGLVVELTAVLRPNPEATWDLAAGLGIAIVFGMATYMAGARVLHMSEVDELLPGRPAWMQNVIKSARHENTLGSPEFRAVPQRWTSSDSA